MEALGLWGQGQTNFPVREKLKDSNKKTGTKSSGNEGLRRLAGSNGTSLVRALVSYRKSRNDFQKIGLENMVLLCFKVIFHRMSFFG